MPRFPAFASIVVLCLLLSGCTKGRDSTSTPAQTPSSGTAPTKTQYVHAETGAVLYEAPDLLSRATATAPDLAQVLSGERSGQWVQVAWQGRTGWTCANKLSDVKSGIAVTKDLIADTWCGENEQPGTGCYTFRDDGTLNIECPMCFHGTWYISDDKVYVQLESPEQSSEGRPLERITYAGTMTVLDGNSLEANFPDGDGVARDTQSWIMTRSDGAVRYSETAPPAQKQQFERSLPFSRPVSDIAVSPDGKSIAVVTYDPDVVLLSMDGTKRTALKGHREDVWGVAFSPDSAIVACGGKDKNVILWDRTGKQLATLKGHTDGVTSVAFSPDGQTIASGSADKTVRLWKRDGTLIRSIEGQGDTVSRLAFSPDGKTLAAALGSGTVKLWTPEGKLVKTLEGHTNGADGVVFSADGKTLATYAGDGIVRLWSPSGGLITVLDTKSPQAASFSLRPDGKVVATGTADPALMLWTADGRLIKTLYGHNAILHTIAFSPDGKTIVTGSEDSTIKFWPFDSKACE